MKLLTRRRSQERQLIFVLSPSRYFITRASLAVVGSALTSSTSFPRHNGAMGRTRYFHGSFAMIIDRLPRSTNVARDRTRREDLAIRPCNTCVGACHARRIKLRSYACRVTADAISQSRCCDICALLIIVYTRSTAGLRLDWLNQVRRFRLGRCDPLENRNVSLNA